LVILVVNDDAYGTIKRHQRERLGGMRIGVDITNPKFSALAEAYGYAYITVSVLENLSSTIEKAFDANRGTLIEIDKQVMESR